MSLSVSTMGLAQLAEFLVANGSYATLSDAVAALNIVITDGVGATGTAIAVTGGAAETAIGTVGQTALDLAAQATLQATGKNVATAGIGLLQGETTTGAAALLGVELGAVAAAAAPILGVSLGVNLYESNPELWTKISQKLLPFCYPGTTQIPTWAEIAQTGWKTSVAKRVIDALKELFEEEGIGGEEGEATFYPDGVSGLIYPNSYNNGIGSVSNYSRTRAGSTIKTYGDFNVAICHTSSSFLPYAYSTTQFDRYYEETDGSTVRWYRCTPSLMSGIYIYRLGSVSLSAWEISNIGPALTGSDSQYDTRDVAKIITGGRMVPAGEYPPGTSPWQGTTPSTIPQSKPAVVGIDDVTGQAVTQPMVPIAPPFPIIVVPDPVEVPEPEIIPFPWPKPETLPETEPWPETMPWPLPSTEPEWWPDSLPYPSEFPVPQPTIDPEISPDPDIITEPEEQVERYILPLPIPYEIPTPDPTPNINVTVDPSSPRAPDKKVTPLPPITEEPPPSGISPWPSLPGTPLAFSQGGGLVTVYHPTPAQLYSFEQWLWVTYADATIDKIFNNPFDGVITLFELYCTPTDVGNQNIKSGFLDSGINSAVISRYTEIDCGTIGIPEYYGNYLDYSPYSKAHVYLPFIGIQELNVDDIVGHAVNITYRIDEYNGSCIAMITVAKVTEVNGEEVEYSNTMYQFSGNCSVELPLAGGSQASIKAGMMTADAYQNAGMIGAVGNLIGGLGSLLMGSLAGTISGIGGAVQGAAYAQAQHTANMLSGKSTVQKSGTFGSSHGALGIKTPFITVTRPKQIQVPDYNELYGYQAHKMVYIGDCTGFLRCREVHVISATASNEEKALIEQLLKTGVYVTE